MQNAHTIPFYAKYWWEGSISAPMDDTYVIYEHTVLQSPMIIGAGLMVCKLWVGKGLAFFFLRSGKVSRCWLPASIDSQQATNYDCMSQDKFNTDSCMTPRSRNRWMHACVYVRWGSYDKFTKRNGRSYIATKDFHRPCMMRADKTFDVTIRGSVHYARLLT